MSFKRTPYSGGGHVPGDIMRVDGPFKLEIECKNRREVKVERIFRNPSIISEYLDPNRILIFNNDGQIYCVINRIHIKYQNRGPIDIFGVITHNEFKYMLIPIEGLSDLHTFIFEEE